ncbi:Gfo/Idh/MocA family oxidoreductase [soil metagenome]
MAYRWPVTPPQPVTVALVGVGVRGSLTYGAYCLAHPDRVRVVALAEPDAARRERFARKHGIPEAATFADWPDMLAGAPPADGVIVAAPDPLHAEPAIAALRLGCDVLLEKPVARTPDELARLLAAAESSTGGLTIAHPLRHAPLFEEVGRLIGEGRIGRLMTIDHVENVGYLHFAHSYVRGNWRRADLAAPMILAKACHDLDLLAWLAGSAWSRVASFGRLSHFRSENAPAGAPLRCIEGCPIQPSCPYDAVAYYLDPATADPWLAAVTSERTDPAIRHALATGPYGRCVYRSDNDVADHQVTIIDFAGGVTATLTVSAFTADVTRTIRLMGTHGEIEGDLLAGELWVRAFTPGKPSPAERRPLSIAGDGHGGGDERLLDAFVAGLEERRAGGRPQVAAGTLEASVAGHVLAFAAERSRTSGAVITAGPRPADG